MLSHLSCWRLATAGGDNNARIWMVHPNMPSHAAMAAAAGTADPSLLPAPHAPRVEYLATLSRHTGVVNVVRFCPRGELLATAGDGQRQRPLLDPLRRTRATKRSAASSPNVLRVDESGRARKVGSERRRAAGAERGTNSSKRSTPAPKSILKHRTIQDMLTLNIGRRAASPAIHTDSMTGCLSTPPTPEVVPSTVASSPSAAEASQRADGLFCTRSETNLPATGVDATVVMPGTPTEGATDYLAAVRLTGSSSTSSASPSAASPSFGPELSLPQVVLPGSATSSASRPPLVRGEGGEQQAEEVSSISSSRRSLVTSLTTVDTTAQSSAPSSSSSYHRMEQGNYHHPRQHQEPQPPHYASQEYADGFLDYEDDDIDIDLSFDADDVDLDLDLDLDDDYADDEQVYLNTYTTYSTSAWRWRWFGKEDRR
ncbi:hypothetical protein A4X13_0g7722 [Tilletia indica]|uniref:Uncharacterized protein n=1 Tax=Tilletia indica TaxID=43049 RepID=A0A8T8SI02_9BASI|nr:hypothetical protein A4X13_0g7722 [Tilletia indica]